MPGWPSRTAVTLALGLGLALTLAAAVVGQTKALPPPFPPIDAKQMLSLPDGAAPGIDATIKRAASGWDIAVSLANLSFPATRSATVPAAGEGHIELFVDNRRVGQTFDTKLHVDPLPAGTHELRLGLYSNDGKAYAVDGSPVIKRFIVWVNRFRTTPNPKAGSQVVDFNVVKGKIVGAPPNMTLQMTQGDTLEIRWTVDEPTQLHFHGYDVETTVTPTAPATMLLTADLAGRFSIERHSTPGTKDSVLHYVEVHP
jgi:hypothetical protein